MREKRERERVGALTSTHTRSQSLVFANRTDSKESDAGERKASDGSEERDLWGRIFEAVKRAAGKVGEELQQQSSSGRRRGEKQSNGL